MKIVHDTQDELHIRFDSVDQIKRYLDDNEDKGYYSDNFESHWSSARFTGTENWEEFMNIVDNGSDKIIKKIKELSKKSANEIGNRYEISHDYKLDVVGQFFDVGMVMSGEPECWLSQYEEEAKKQIEINVNASYLSGVKHDTIIDNASRIIGMILTLEKMGIETKLNLNFRSNDIYKGNSRKAILVSLVAKDYEQGVDYKKLSALLHTSMFRRGIFRIREVEVWDKMDSYGVTTPLAEDTLIDKISSIDELEQKLFGGKK